MEQGGGIHGTGQRGTWDGAAGGETELPGGETEPAAGWNGAAGNMGRGGGAGSWNLWFL